jgi:putative Holliday junction resolvase
VRVGIDIGSVRIGIAVSDPDGVLATPVHTVQRQRDGSDLAQIDSIVVERDAVEVVVGLPRSLSGHDGAAADAARAYAQRLAARLEVPVRLVDERLSTVQAEADLRAAGVRSKKQRPVVDQAAAVVVLQAALDQERTAGEPPGELVQQ